MGRMRGVSVLAPTRVDALALIPTLRSLGCEVRTGRDPLAQGRSDVAEEVERLAEASGVVERRCPAIDDQAGALAWFPDPARPPPAGIPPPSTRGSCGS